MFYDKVMMGEFFLQNGRLENGRAINYLKYRIIVNARVCDWRNIVRFVKTAARCPQFFAFIV